MLSNKGRHFVAVASRSRLALGCVRNKATAATDEVDAKPISEVPGDKGLPIVGNLLSTIAIAKESHKWAEEQHRKHGPIFRSRAGILDMVMLADVQAIEQLLRQDGKYPRRLAIEVWNDYRRRHNIPLGLVMANGPDWHRQRSVIAPYLLKIRTVNSYEPVFNNVVTEFIERIYRVRRSDNTIPQLEEHLFKWSVESICHILFEKRLGCLSDNPDPDTKAFTDSVHDIFESARKVVFLPPWLARLVRRKDWNMHESAWDTVFRIAFKMIDEKIAEVEKRGDHVDELGFLANLLTEKALSTAEIYSSVTDMMGAAVDTTSNTTQHVINEIARNPEVQNTLLEEVNRVVPPDSQPTAEHLKDMHYLKAVIKETLRMYPAGAVVFRHLSQDAVVLGYHLPKGTAVGVHLYVLGRLPQHYDDPDSFRPERWLREEGREKINPFAWLPFGFGPRMCAGRRIAELEMQLLVSRLVREFRVEPVTDDPMELKTDLILLPKNPVQVRLTER